MITTTFNQELLGQILAAKYLRALAGDTSIPIIAKRIAYTVFPNGIIIRYKEKPNSK